MKKLTTKLVAISSLLVVALLLCNTGFTADIDISWEQSVGADGYKVQTSEDYGATWTEVSNLIWETFTEGTKDKARATITVADNVLVLARVGAYNSNSETWRLESGIFFNSAWKPIIAPVGIGVN